MREGLISLLHGRYKRVKNLNLVREELTLYSKLGINMSIHELSFVITEKCNFRQSLQFTERCEKFTDFQLRMEIQYV